MEIIQLKYCIYTFQHNLLLKSTDVSAVEYSAFGFIKRAFSKQEYTTFDGIWKVIKEECQAISLEILIKNASVMQSTKLDFEAKTKL